MNTSYHPSKRGDMDQLVGETITSCEGKAGDEQMTFFCASGKVFTFWLEDDGGGTGNDSHAFISGISIPIGEPITLVTERGRDSYGARFVFGVASVDEEDAAESFYLDVTHEHNGYYGWGYELKECAS